MKTVPIYTDGHKNQCGFMRDVGSARPFGATAEHDKQAPSNRCIISRGKLISKELL